MLRVVETFSGIGSQAKALNNINAKYEIVATVEWDINAIYAYDIIHNGEQDKTKYMEHDKNELVEKLMRYTLSSDGKKQITSQGIKLLSKETLRRLLCAIERTNNLVSITDVKAVDLPQDINLLTYSFPCQDLSVCGFWHGNTSGISRNIVNRSGMLWEIERILKEYVKIDKKLPEFLLMENVSNILSDNHKTNFDEWQKYLNSIGYYNKIYTLNSYDFGIPQKRKRTFMISVQYKNNILKDEIEEYFKSSDLETQEPFEVQPLIDFIRTDYSQPKYKQEADLSNPNFTPSRKMIFENNEILFDGTNVKSKAVKTITTKQDRNPNSGILMYDEHLENKSPYRNLTPRECFLLMGFDELDFEALMENDFYARSNRKFFTREKLIRMAGNSIVVDVLESIFRQILEIKEDILDVGYIEDVKACNI